MISFIGIILLVVVEILDNNVIKTYLYVGLAILFYMLNFSWLAAASAVCAILCLLAKEMK